MKTYSHIVVSEMNNIIPKIGKVFEIGIIIEHVRVRSRVRVQTCVRVRDRICELRSPKDSRFRVQQSRPKSVRLRYGNHHFVAFDEMHANEGFPKQYFHADLEKFAGLNLI